MLAETNHSRLLHTLRTKISSLEGPQRAGGNRVFSTGIAPLDRLLAPGGLRQGTLSEWLSDQPGSGGFTLAYLAARAAARGGKHIVISDRTHTFFAAAVSFPAQVVILRPLNAADELWAIDQSLRCPGVAAVWADLPSLREHDFRRLQLAAEAGGTLGLLCRSSRVRGHPSWSDVQFLVTPQPAQHHRRLKVEVVRARGSIGGAKIMLEIDDHTGEVREVSQHETHSLPAISSVAASAAYRRQA